jgi:Fic family protein
MVIEHGVTIGGKPLKDHLEAVDHFEALRCVRDLARHSAPLREADIATCIGSSCSAQTPTRPGATPTQGRYVETDSGRHHFPSPAEVPSLVGELAQRLDTAAANSETAFAAHRRLVEIHPFNDGNGRTARLLMNLVRLRCGYPPVAVRPQDRPAYIGASQDAQAGRGSERFDPFFTSD